MSEQINPRSLVLDILLAVERDGEFSHIAVRQMLDKYRYLPHRDRAFIKRVSEGTIERQIELDYIIRQFSKIRVKKMKPVIRAILESGVYQLFYMDAVPDSAVCNEAVKLAVTRGVRGIKGICQRRPAQHCQEPGTDLLAVPGYRTRTGGVGALFDAGMAHRTFFPAIWPGEEHTYF